MRLTPALLLVLLLIGCSSGAGPEALVDTVGGADGVGAELASDDAAGDVGEDAEPEVLHLEPIEPMLAQSLQSLLE